MFFRGIILYWCLNVLDFAEASKIKHVVALMLENRPFDHIFGWKEGVDGLSGNEFNYLDPLDANSEKVYVDNKCPYINDCDPAHGTSATTSKIYSGDECNIPDNGGFVSYEQSNPNFCDVMSGFSPDRLPVINQLASEFALMDRFFASHPGPTWPNRMFALSGTSAGSTETFVWYHDDDGALFPQKTIFDQIEESQLTWRNYYNDTPWELFMEKIANNPDNLLPMDIFYEDAARGSLPAFSWINPRSGINITTGVGSNDQHPDHDMNVGEQYLKDIYEALRSSPQWNETLLVVTYDEHGGFYDHVVPPYEGVPPPDDGEASYPADGFLFDRLGLRVPTLLISPWIRKGTVISSPPESHRPQPSSEFDLTSILASTRNLLGMPSIPLTSRDAWTGTFDFVVDELQTPREDCPLHLVDPIPPVPPEQSKEHLLPLNSLQRDIALVHARLAGVAPLADNASQGVHSEWVQRHYDIHAAHTRVNREHATSVAPLSYSVVTMAKVLFGDDDSYVWDFNGLPYGGSDEYANNTMPYITISTRNVLVPVAHNISVPLCLDAGEGRVGSVLRAVPCFPCVDPAYNRASSQHFVLRPDASLRFYDATVQPADADSFLCVTSHHPLESDPSTLVNTLEFCRTGDTGRVEQAWAYHGGAPGVSNGGQLLYGDGSNTLGVVKKQ